VIDDFTYQTEETVDYIIEKLRKEKILDKNKCLGLPYPPFRIAIISSPTSE
jgi:exonuclease VII large subunit